MRKSRLKAYITIKIKSKNNHLDPNKIVLKNNSFDNIIKVKGLLEDLSYLNNKYL